MKKVTTVRFEVDELAALERMAALQETTVSALIRESVTRLVEERTVGLVAAAEQETAKARAMLAAAKEHGSLGPGPAAEAWLSLVLFDDGSSSFVAVPFSKGSRRFSERLASALSKVVGKIGGWPRR